MSFIDHEARELHLKILYWGVGSAGKTTNLQHIYSRTPPERRSTMISLETDIERTLFFDFEPAALRSIRGHRVRVHLYCLPGCTQFYRSLQLVTKGVDGVVFVVDTHAHRVASSVESLDVLRQYLFAHGACFEATPLVFQYNKVDLEDSVAPALVDRLLNDGDRPWFPAVASRGEGVFDALKACVKAVLVATKGSTAPRAPLGDFEKGVCWRRARMRVGEPELRRALPPGVVQALETWYPEPTTPNDQPLPWSD